VEPRYEIERRYLVRVVADLWERLGAGHGYRQGYLRGHAPSVRIRFGEPRGPVLTCKSGSGVKRREVEAVVPEDVAEALMEAAKKRVIEKTRWAIGPWELDRFTGPLEGLTLLEIELGAVDDPVPLPPDGIDILREVTDDSRFTSNNLARMSKKEQKRFVTRAYAEVEDV
jgi:CYTH domain-containing protein